MNEGYLAVITRYDVIYFGSIILVVFLLLFAIFCFGVWLTRRPDSVSPYTKKPLRRARDLNWAASEKVLRYLYEMHDYDNKIFDIKKASVCRETGRIFPDSLTWFDRIELDWTFLEKRFPGDYVSWGSLIPEQQKAILVMHGSLKGFQTENSCPNPSPRDIEPEYIGLKPGPLYVDVSTNIVLGWKCIPETSLEVMVVQKPKKDYDFR